MPIENPAQQCSVSWLCYWSLGYSFRRWRLLLGVLVSRLVGLGLDLLKPWPMVILVDYALRGKKMPAFLAATMENLGGVGALNVINWAVAATVVVFLLGWLVGLANAYSILCLRQRMIYDLAGDVFSKLQQHSLQYHAKAAVADNMRRITSDSNCASMIVLDALLPACVSALSIIAMFGILWRLERTLALISLTVVPYMLFVLRHFALPLKKGVRDLHARQGRMQKLVEQAFVTIPVVQAFSRERANAARFAEIGREVLDATLSRNWINTKFSALIGLATASGSATILWFGGQKALTGAMSVGAIIAFLSYLGSLYGPLEGILKTGPTIHEAANRASYIRDILHNKTFIKEKRGAKKLQVPHGYVRLENVTFGYDADRPILRNINFECLPGRTVALVGATGAGKSTLVSLLPRFFDPWEGTVLIDGQDVRDVQLKSLRDSIGFVLQDPFLFPVSLAENIAYGNPHADFHQIEAAARAANAHEFICRLPKGYNTLVGEGGATLSGGERQRISIARALLKNSPILILDEPTSALDKETEKGLLQALKRLTQGRTTFVIAHRLSTIRNADSILVLEDGRIAESGTHDQLVAYGGIYARCYDLQSSVKTSV